VDFDLYGHRIVTLLVDSAADKDAGSNPVDGHGVARTRFQHSAGDGRMMALADRLGKSGTVLEIPPTIRFKTKPIEQASMCFRAPAGSSLKMKAFANLDQMVEK
jgi:extradiol dioxygenase family protein